MTRACCLWSHSGLTAEEIFFTLAIEDIQAATDLFLPLYQQTNGADGYVSIEVSPYLANDTEATLSAGQRAMGQGQPPQFDD